MGLPDGQEVYSPHRSRLSQSSDDSMLLSCGSSPGRSVELESITTGSSSSRGSSRSSQHNDTTPSWHRNNNRSCAEQSRCNLCTMCQKPRKITIHQLRNHAVNCPDNIRWNTGAKKVTITPIEGKVGFKYKDVRGADVCYTMVIDVGAKGPSDGRISIGDCILSANGRPIQVSQGIDLKSILCENKSDTVTLMVQSPESMIDGSKWHNSSCAQRTPPPESRMRSGRVGANLNTLMPRLPKLRVLISGSEAEPIATSLLQGGTQLRRSATDVGFSYQAFVSENNSLYTKNGKQKNLDSFANSKSVDEVELEVIALKDTPFPTYCHHVLATAHSIFIVQFSHRAFIDINNRQSVLMSIQQRLNKIRTYASNTVPIYLVMTSEDVAPPAEQLSNIGKILNLQFSEGFKNQLQYNPKYPLFTAITHPPRGGGNEKNLPSPFGNLGRQISREDNSDTGQSHVLYSRDNDSLDVCYYAKSTELINRQGDRYDVRMLRERLSGSAFRQDFIRKSYPYSFMKYRESVKPQGVNSLHYQPKAWIKTVCGGIQNNLDPDRLLRFLHDNGDIVCSDYLEYSSSKSDMILLDREYLITLTKRLTRIPSRSQQQDPCLNDSIRHWDDLQEKSMASSTFLKYLFCNPLESLNILVTLSQMNLIHCLELTPPNSQLVTSHIVPFFLPDKKAPSRQGYNHDPRLYNLCVDFHGSIPDGVFMSGLVELIKEAEKTNGTWSMDSTTSAHLSLGIDCELDIYCDEVQSVITISARCSVSYQHRNLLFLLNRIFNPPAAVTSDLRVTIGPPCPLYQEQCKTRNQVPWKAHVIDVAGGQAGKGLWCGNVRVDEYQSVNRWLYRLADRPPLTPGSADKLPVSRRTHIFQLPPAMIHWLCDKLNAPPVGRNWRGLADDLGYTYADVTVFANRRQSDYDPCNALLLDWGCSANSTLELLMNHLECQRMRRMDILTMLYEKWILVD